MWKFKDTIEQYFKDLLSTEEIFVSKSNPQSPQCWNEKHCEVSIDDEEGGRLILKISISEKFDNEVTGEIEEVWYWDEDLNPEPVVSLFLGGNKNVVITFDNDASEGVMKSYYGGNIL